MGVSDVPAGRYEVMPGEGYIEIRIRRAGPLAALGHNHVITSDRLVGSVVVAEGATGSTATFELPVDSLVVDPAEARAAAGAEFASVPTEADKDGTTANMRGPRVLNAAAYPVIRAGFTADRVERNVTIGQLAVELAGHTAFLPVSGDVTLVDGALEVRTAFTVTHAALGLVPFSVMGGALSVAETIEVSVRLTARRRS